MTPSTFFSSTSTWRGTWPVSATTSSGPFRLDQYEPEVAARGPGMKEDIALRFRAAKYLPSRERVAKEDLDPAVKAALGLTRKRRARRTGASKKRKTAGSAEGRGAGAGAGAGSGAGASSGVVVTKGASSCSSGSSTSSGPEEDDFLDEEEKA